MDNPDGAHWREVVSRGAMVLLALIFLAGGGGLLYAAWAVLRSADGRGGFVPIGLAFLGCGAGVPGLFFLKRPVLPSHVDERPPTFGPGDRAGPDGAPWWAQVLDIF